VGSKLAVVAAVIAFAAPAFADDAKELFKQGVDAYKAGHYDDSKRLLERSYKLDANPNTLFALAQAERLLGECKLAVEHYNKVLEQVNDLNVSKLVQQNLSLCEKQEPGVVPAPASGKSEPQVVTKVVTRDVGHGDKLAITAMTFGALSLGAAGGLYIASSSNQDAADKARTLDDHNTLADRANSEKTMCYVAAGAGVALAGFAVYRWVSGSSGEASTAVSVVPTPRGGAFVVTSAW
jgi:tetratricopeptide (TPR) repeat protein